MEAEVLLTMTGDFSRGLDGIELEGVEVEVTDGGTVDFGEIAIDWARDDREEKARQTMVRLVFDQVLNSHNAKRVQEPHASQMAAASRFYDDLKGISTVEFLTRSSSNTRFSNCPMRSSV